MKTVLFDTNFFYVKLSGRDLFEEVENALDSQIELITMDKCIKELTGFAKGKTKEAAGARVALAIIKGKHFAIKTASGKTDNSILLYAQEHPETIVATNDVILRKRLREANIKVLTLHGASSLVVV